MFILLHNITAYYNIVLNYDSIRIILKCDSLLCRFSQKPLDGCYFTHV